jgi:hypothetical protein
MSEHKATNIGMTPDDPSKAAANCGKLVAADGVIDLEGRRFYLSGNLRSNRSHRIINGTLAPIGEAIHLVDSKPERVLSLKDVDVISDNSSRLFRIVDPLFLANSFSMDGGKVYGKAGVISGSLDHATDPAKVKTGFMDSISIQGVKFEDVIGSAFSITNGEFEECVIADCEVANCAGVLLAFNIYHPDNATEQAKLNNWMRYKSRRGVVIKDNQVTGGPLTLDWPEEFNKSGGVYQVPFLFKAYDIEYSHNDTADYLHRSTYKNSKGETRNRSTYASYLHSTKLNYENNEERNVGHTIGGTVFAMAKGVGPDAWTDGCRIIYGNTFDSSNGTIGAYYEPIDRILWTGNYFDQPMEIANTPVRVRSVIAWKGNNHSGISGKLRVSDTAGKNELVIKTDGTLPWERTNPWDGLKQAPTAGNPPKVEILPTIPAPVTPEPIQPPVIPEVVQPPVQEQPKPPVVAPKPEQKRPQFPVAVVVFIIGLFALAILLL